MNIWLRNPANNLTLENVYLVQSKNADNIKSIENGQGIAFDGKVSWSFDNDAVRNVLTFSVNNSQLTNIDNPKNNFLVLGKRSN